MIHNNKTHVRVYLGEYIGSDQNLLVTNFCFRIKINKRTN